MLKRTVSFILAAVTVAFSLAFLTSCSFGKMSEEEARAELERLLPKAKELCSIFLSDGLKPEEPTEETKNYYYRKVRSDSPYKTIEELKAAAEEVFSSDFLSKEVYIRAFEGLSEERIRPKFGKSTDGVLTIYVGKDAENYPIRQEIYLDTLKVIDGNKYTAIIEVDAKSSQGKTVTITISLVKENGKWLLNSFPY